MAAVLIETLSFVFRCSQTDWKDISADEVMLRILINVTPKPYRYFSKYTIEMTNNGVLPAKV